MAFGSSWRAAVSNLTRVFSRGRKGRFDANESGVRRMMEGNGGEVSQGMHKASKKVVRNVEETANQRTTRQTGTYSRSIKADFTTPTSFDVYSDAPHAIFLEFGTRPHIIVPVHARALRFIGTRDGQVVFTKLVHHPGIAPRNIIRDGATRDRNVL